jgi:hypothetical protein
MKDQLETVGSAIKTVRRMFEVLLLFSCLSACGITPVVVTELANANGYKVEMGYQSDGNLILSHLRVHMTMEINGSVVRTAEQDYWEYFILRNLRTTDEQNWAPSQWPTVKEFVDKNFFYQDLIRAGPLLVVGTPPPSQFLVKIRQMHALHVGGRVQGHTPRGQFHGLFGYLQKDAAGNQFVARRIDVTGVTDDSQLWANQNRPLGRVMNAGEHVQTLVLEHESAWGQAQGETDWGVEWKYVRNFGDERLERRGSDVHQTPQPGP